VTPWKWRQLVAVPPPESSTTSHKIQQLAKRADVAVAERKAQFKQAAEDVRADAEPVDAFRPRRAIASYATDVEAERAVDRLSDQGFAVQRSAIVGRGLRSVEQVTGAHDPRTGPS
jgi:hypothetical protein